MIPVQALTHFLQWTQVLRDCPEALAVIDHDGHFLLCNASCAKLLQRNSIDLLGKNITQVTACQYVSYWEEHWNRCLNEVGLTTETTLLSASLESSNPPNSRSHASTICLHWKDTQKNRIPVCLEIQGQQIAPNQAVFLVSASSSQHSTEQPSKPASTEEILALQEQEMEGEPAGRETQELAPARLAKIPLFEHLFKIHHLHLQTITQDLDDSIIQPAVAALMHLEATIADWEKQDLKEVLQTEEIYVVRNALAQLVMQSRQLLNRIESPLLNED
ncbi:Hypothetical protein PBC10988_28490 [Planctomycetales bacterium 10988]|nr:Hypothetical protein PBC10988_28490 [Planctomycetales bacterium 10988]